MKKTVLALGLVLALGGCLGNPISMLTGGGPNVAANTQIGKENSQTIGQDTDITGETVTVNNTGVPVWAVAVIAVLSGFLIPSPQELWRAIRRNRS